MALAVVGFGVLMLIANAPTTTSVFVDFKPQPVTEPLYAKIVAFVDRDIQVRQLAARVVGDASDPEDKADRILKWTTANIRPTPAGMRIIDDHPLNIVVRGYGEVDQAADVFANLAAYSGMPGGLVFSRGEDGAALYAFAVVEMNGARMVFDVREGRGLRDRRGALAPLEELRAHPELLDDLPSPAGAHGLSYRTLITRLEGSPHRPTSDQMPVWRFLDEVGRMLRRH